jgi:hypothetical protein
MDIFDIAEIDEFRVEKPLKSKTNTFQKEAKEKTLKRGGYRPVLIDLAIIKNEAQYMEHKIGLLIQSWRNGVYSEPDITALYVLTYLDRRYGGKFLENFDPILKKADENSQVKSSSLRESFGKLLEDYPNLAKRLAETNTNSLFDIINNYNLHSIPKPARTAIAKWYTGEYSLFLIGDVATVEGMIECQSEAKRCLTVASKNLGELIEDSRDALSFLLHDLVHAYKMFENEVLLRGQVGFSIAMLKVVKCGLIKELLENDEQFKENLNYVVSDMNSHSKHLFFSFKASLVNAFKRKFGLNESEKLNGESLERFNESFRELLDLFEMSDEEKRSATEILSSQNQFDLFDYRILNEYFLGLYANKFQ